MPELSALVTDLRRRLRAATAPGGGWPYYDGKAARIEATAWALLALGETWDDSGSAWQELARPHWQFLASRQRADGLLVEAPGLPPNLVSNGVAACLLVHGAPGADPRIPAPAAHDDVAKNPDGPDAARLFGGLVALKGISVNAPDPRQDNTLQGWPWMPDTFSWVEPTAWCLLALKSARRAGFAHTPAMDARIDEAEKLLVNRACETGGWNYGNASVIGQDLRPYIPTTALGLVAMQDRRTEPAVARSLVYLLRERAHEPSAAALALAATCLRVYGLPSGDIEDRLAADLPRAVRLGNLQTVAMALYALAGEHHRAKAFLLAEPGQR